MSSRCERYCANVKLYMPSQPAKGICDAKQNAIKYTNKCVLERTASTLDQVENENISTSDARTSIVRRHDIEKLTFNRQRFAGRYSTKSVFAMSHVVSNLDQIIKSMQKFN